MLRDAGYAVATAPDGAAALEILTTHEPSVILVDLRMPGMDGWSFIDRYRRRGGRARIVLMTALVDAVNSSHIAGVDALVRKPFDLKVLLTTIGQVRECSDSVGSPVADQP